MDNLNELGNIWQNQPLAETSPKEIDLKGSGIINKLKKLEQKHQRINRLKTITVIICLAIMSYTILKLPDITYLIKIALGWIICSLSIFMIMYWKKQYNSSRLGFNKNSSEFISSTIEKLKSQKQIITHLVPGMVYSLIIGLNLIYFDLLKTEDITIRLSLHLIVTSLLILAMYLGLKVRKKRFTNDFKPLIEELELIKQNFENNEQNI